MTFQIKEAHRAGARLVLVVAGNTGSGKTRTALELAYGLSGYDASKIGFLDTENRRGSLYSDVLVDKAGKVQRFKIADMEAPFSPARYVAGIRAFEEAGCSVLIIDSITHEWEGDGGCMDIADAAGRKDGWLKAKAEHKRFMRALLSCSMDVICCVRARPKTKVVNRGGKVEYVDEGIQPICEKNFMFEATASLLMHDRGRVQDVIKLPDELAAHLGRGQGYITAADGAAIRAWRDGGEPVDPAVERYRSRLMATAEDGLSTVRQNWAKTPAEVRSALGEGFRDELFDAAKEFDRIRQMGPKGQAASLNEAVLGSDDDEEDDDG